MLTSTALSVNKKGFTLIELLIVIAVLGILAIAVLSAINPIEQINRSKDTGSRSDAEQLISASDRYYASNGYYPWQLGASSTNTAITPLTEITGKTQTFGSDAQQLLINLSSGGSAELKDSFITRIIGSAYNRLYIYNRGTQGDSTYVCFVGKSSSFLTEAGTRCGGTLPSDYPAACPAGCAAANPKTCYSCLP